MGNEKPKRQIHDAGSLEFGFWIAEFGMRKAERQIQDAGSLEFGFWIAEWRFKGTGYSWLIMSGQVIWRGFDD